MFGEAETEFSRATQITGESIDALAGLGHCYPASGRKEAALKILDQLTEFSTRRYVSPYDRSLIHAALGEIDEAFSWQERAYNECVEWTIYMSVDPRLDPVRGDVRFMGFLERVELPK